MTSPTLRIEQFVQTKVQRTLVKVAMCCVSIVFGQAEALTGTLCVELYPSKNINVMEGQVREKKNLQVLG